MDRINSLGTNTLAYFGHMSVMKIEKFIRLTPGFGVVITVLRNFVERLARRVRPGRLLLEPML